MEMKERWGRMQDMCQVTASEQGEREGKKEETEREGQMVDGMGQEANDMQCQKERER